MTAFRAEEPRALDHRLSECKNTPKLAPMSHRVPSIVPRMGPGWGPRRGVGDSGIPGRGSNDKFYCQKWCPLRAY